MDSLLSAKVFASPVGPIYLHADDGGLRSLYFKPVAEVHPGPRPGSAAAAALDRTVRELDEYFSGKRKIFTLPVARTGTEFQRRVWLALTSIPYGETISYAELARLTGNPAAVRAVGSANGKNPFSLLVPCHRVIATGGSLGGYSGGLAIKQRLLDFERSGRL